MSRESIIPPLILISTLIGCSSPNADSVWKREFGEPIPSHAKLIAFDYREELQDSVYAFVFQVDNRHLVDSIISSQQLREGKASSTMALKEIGSWPTTSELDEMRSYERTDEKTERYWSMWINEKNNRVFVEFGAY